MRFPLLHTLESLLRRLKDRVYRPALCKIGLLLKALAIVYTHADGVFIFVPCHRNIDAVYNVLERYEKITGAKYNHDKTSGL